MNRRRHCACITSSCCSLCNVRPSWIGYGWPSSAPKCFRVLQSASLSECSKVFQWPPERSRMLQSALVPQEHTRTQSTGTFLGVCHASYRDLNFDEIATSIFEFWNFLGAHIWILRLSKRTIFEFYDGSRRAFLNFATISSRASYWWNFILLLPFRFWSFWSR